MKINEVIIENLDEIAFTKRGRQMKRAFKKGQQVIKQTVDKMNNDFAEFLGVRGKRNLRQADTSDVVDFLKMKKVDTSDIDTNKPMDKKTIQQIFQQKARETVQGMKSQPAATPTQSNTQTRQEPKLTRRTQATPAPQFKSRRTQSQNPTFRSTRTNTPPAGLS